MRLAMIEADAARLARQRQRQRIRGRAGADEEHRHLALEDLVEFLIDGLVEFAVAVGRDEAGAMRGEGRAYLGVGASPIVRSKNHVLPNRLPSEKRGGQCLLSQRASRASTEIWPPRAVPNPEQ
jgi:hypothetical protein